jgi:uncharacterized protein (TIGR02996 family)
MPSHAGFLRDVLADPEDDAPRLVYADWLDEHGDEARAELIRVGCERARLEEGPRWAALAVRERQLLAAHGGTWKQEVAAWARPGCWFERGFVAGVEGRAGQFCERGEALYRRAPVRHAALRCVTGCITQMTMRPVLAPLRALDLLDGIWADYLPRWLACPHLAGLRALGLCATPRHRFPRESDLAELRRLTALEELTLAVCPLTPLAVHTLLEASVLQRLRALRLATDQLREGLRTLLEKPELPHLTALQISHTGYLSRYGSGPPGGGALTEHFSLLAGSPLLPRLERLSLAGNDMNSHTLSALLAWPALGRLRVLDLSANRLYDGAVEQFLAAPHLPPLRALYLRDNCLGDRGVRLLAATDRLPHLAVLDVRNNGTTPAAEGELRERFGVGAWVGRD